MKFVKYFAEQQRDNDRALRRAGRDIERERRKLMDEEKKIVILFKYFHLIYDILMIDII